MEDKAVFAYVLMGFVGIFLWLGPTIANGIIAKNKNRNVIVWIVVGLLTGFFSTLVLLFLQDRYE